jgi:SAM-dependent methyltransferase
MPISDDENLALAESPAAVDDLNARFYSEFPYPWRPPRLEYRVDRDLDRVMVNHGIGDWRAETIPKTARVWVAGCGTNQAVLTALRFPWAHVIGSDVSPQSLALTAQSAENLALSNLELRRESIHAVDYRHEFDYVICTGVIHHNANPAAVLLRLAEALKPSGILELMVYNRYQRIAHSVFQRAVQILARGASAPDLQTELAIARRLIAEAPTDSMVFARLGSFRHGGDPVVADALIQPVEHSYTVESLGAMVDACGLEVLLPCVNIFDIARNTTSWGLTFPDPWLQQIYDGLPDLSRWQVSNLLGFERSPMLWFYLQRTDAGRPRRSERQICDDFLSTVFTRVRTSQRQYRLSPSGRYEPVPDALPFPPVHGDEQLAALCEAADGVRPMHDLFEEAGLSFAFADVSRARIGLTTPTFPYLRAV